jgi:hypothetical protein
MTHNAADAPDKQEVYEISPEVMPEKTIPRPRELNDLDPLWAALAVGEFLGAPQEAGDWRLRRFEIDDEGVLVDYLRMHGDGHGRWSASKGTLLKLERFRGEGRGETWMTNTAQEVLDHQHAFENAHGRVLVHGLGLSCVVSGLLALEAVEHIDVVEMDPNVIALVGPAYADEERVTIHQGNCLTFPWPDSVRWNYVWHDIWATISDANLDEPEAAENGITYEMLRDQFADRADMQGFWAEDVAKKMRRRRLDQIAETEIFRAKWKTATFEERLDMLVDWKARSQFSAPGVVEAMEREQIVDMLDFLGQLETFFIIASEDEPPRLLF